MNDLVDEAKALDAVLRTDLTAFIERAFLTVVPQSPYLPNWHIELVADRLMKVERGDLLRLIVNQPPRSLKSLSASVAFVAWALGRNPGLRIVVVSYSNEFAAELHRQFRLVVNADWYARAFPRIVLAKDIGLELVTTEGGGRFATSIGGTFTGRGADLVIIDDPQKEDEAMSEVARRRVVDWFSGTLLSRLNDKARSPIVVVQQRLHEDDLSGHLIRQGGWDLLKLSAIAEADENHEVGAGILHTRRAGEALHPERESLKTLMRLKSDKGSLLFSAHYLQEPVPLQGNLVRREWLRFFDAAPSGPREQIVQSWDIATTIGERNDFSVCLTAQLVGNDFFVLDVWRGRLAYPDLRRKVIALWQAYCPETILVEDAGPGLQLLQDLLSERPAGMNRPIGVKPEGSKADRMSVQSAKIEAGHLLLRRDAPWEAEFLKEVLAFPNGRHDDQVDALSQLLGWWSARLVNRNPWAGIIVGPEVIHAW